MWRLPGQTGPCGGPRQSRGLDPRCGARAAPRTRPPHRPDWQRPFRDGRAGRSRGPCRRPVASTGGWAGLACMQRPVGERVGEELERRLCRAGVNRSPEWVRELGMDHCQGLRGRAGIGGQATGRGRAARGGGCRVRITSGWRLARAQGWRRGRARARRIGVDDDAATRMRRVLCVPALADTMVTRSRLQGLRSCDFGGSMPPRAASWSLLAHRQCGLAVKVLQPRISPIGEPMAKGPRNCLGLTGRCSTSGSERVRADWLPAAGSDIRDALQVQPRAARDLRCDWGIDRVTAGDHCSDTCRRSKARHGGAAP
jgi:hypothetical protein